VVTEMSREAAAAAAAAAAEPGLALHLQLTRQLKERKLLLVESQTIIKRLL